MANEIKYEDFARSVNVKNSFGRNAAIPLDKSSWFSSLADAQKYANGEGDDERGIGLVSYAGQMIAVKTGQDTNKNGIYKSYIIQGDGTLNEVGGVTFKVSEDDKLQFSQDGGKTWADITLPSSAAGAAGATGIQGMTGLQGATGLRGAAGAQGITGAKGADGKQGITGAQGVTGAKGADGTNGKDGVQGATGPRGATGLQGPKGAQGNPGEQGATGLQGPKGEKGDKGADGTGVAIKASKEDCKAVGDGYIDANGHLQMLTTLTDTFTDCGEIKGPKGDQGATGLQGPKGAQGNPGEQGATGPRGATGATGMRGNRTFYGEDTMFANTTADTIQVVLSAGQFVTGDFYCYTKNADWTVWSCDDIDDAHYTFTNRGSIKGADGKDGTNGAQGVTGAQGATGIQGMTGPAGKDGSDADATYDPSDETLSTMQLGGIPENTKASNLKGKTVSELFDMLLFPTYVPIFVDAKLTATLSSAALVEIGGTLPTPSYTTSVAYTQTSSGGANKALGGTATVSMTAGSNNSSSTVGKKTWSYKADFAQGTDLIKDSKGNNTNQTAASGYNTLLGGGTTSYAANIGGTGPAKYVIAARTNKTSSASCEVVYPYYVPNANGAETKRDLTTETSFLIKDYSATNANAQVFCAVPSSFTNVSITQANVSGEFKDPCTLANSKLVIGATGMKQFGSVSVPYTRYRFKTNDLAGKINYKVAFTKG